MPGDRSVYVYDPMDEPLDWLRERGVSVTLGAPEFSTGQMRPKVPEDALIEAARGNTALMGASGTRITRRVMEAMPELRYISKLGIGCEVIDLKAATDHGIRVTNTPVRGEVALVAEHTIALMLGLLKKVNVYANGWVRGGGWKDPQHMSGSLRDATVGIVGFGHIGRAVAQRLQGWGARVLVSDVRLVTDISGVVQVDLETLLRTADVVTLHTPGLPAGTRPLLDTERLALLKPTAVLVNTARGNLIDTGALTDRLRRGLLAGAGLDVYDPEPPDQQHPLLGLPNVLLTPHAAAWNRPLRKEMAMLAFENLLTMFDGGVPDSLVNREVLEASR